MIRLVIVVTGLTGYAYPCKGSSDCDDSDDDDAECNSDVDVSGDVLMAQTCQTHQ